MVYVQAPNSISIPYKTAGGVGGRVKLSMRNKLGQQDE